MLLYSSNTGTEQYKATMFLQVLSEETNVVLCRATQCSADFYWQRKTNFMHSWDLIWTYRLFLEEKPSKSTAAVKCLFYWPLWSHTAQIKPRGIFHWNSFHSQPTSVPTRSVAISSGRRTQWGPNPAKRGLNLCYTTRVIITHTAAVKPFLPPPWRNSVTSICC